MYVDCAKVAWDGEKSCWKLTADGREFSYPAGMLTAALPEEPMLQTSASHSASIEEEAEPRRGDGTELPPSLDQMMSSKETVDVE